MSDLEKENKESREALRTSCRYYAPGGECALTAHNCPGTAKCIGRYKQKLEKIKGYCIPQLMFTECKNRILEIIESTGE